MPRIRVGVRIKPDDIGGKLLKGFDIIEENGMKKVFFEISDIKHEFTFESVFDGGCGQMQLFEHVARPIIDEVVEGINGTIFAFGQTV